MPGAKVRYDREVIEFSDEGHASLDWAMETGSFSASSLSDNAPIALIIHGLTGCSDAMRPVCAEALARGYRPVAFNRRGHGGLPLATPKLQDFGCVQDLKQVIDHIERKYPQTKLYGIAYSAGCALLWAYFGETGEQAKLQAGALVSPGYNEYDMFCGGCIHPVYDFLMTFSLKQMLLSHQDKLQHVVHVPSALKTKSVGEFYAQTYMKMHGFQDMESYFQHNNPMRAVHNIERPMLCLNALDDPVCKQENIRYDLFTGDCMRMLVETSDGSHCAFYEGHVRPQTWAPTVVMTYLDSVRAFNQSKHTQEELKTSAPVA